MWLGGLCVVLERCCGYLTVRMAVLILTISSLLWLPPPQCVFPFTSGTGTFPLPEMVGGYEPVLGLHTHSPHGIQNTGAYAMGPYSAGRPSCTT